MRSIDGSIDGLFLPSIADSFIARGNRRFYAVYDKTPVDTLRNECLYYAYQNGYN